MWNLVWSPVRFFDARRRRHPGWVTALAAPSLCAGLQGVSVSIFSGKTRPMVDAALARLNRVSVILTDANDAYERVMSTSGS